MKPGNRYSAPTERRIDPSAYEVINVTLDQVIPPLDLPKDAPSEKHVRVTHGRVVDWVSQHFLACCVSLALILSLQLVPHSHFVSGDDYIHLGTLDGSVHDFGSGPFRLYEFMDGSAERLRRQMEKGPMPWFTEPGIKIQFLRPISSGLVALDHSIFGHRSWGYRIQGILWYVVLVVAHALWTRGIVPDSAGRQWTAAGRWHPTAMLATLMFVVCDNQWFNVFWTAGRWVLVSSALALLGCVFYDRWRSGWRPGLPLAIVAIVGGLLSGEVALAVLAFPLAAEIIHPPGDRTGRFRGLIVLLSLGVSYLLFYVLLGYGSKGTDVYLSPMGDPLAYLAQLPTRMLEMSGEVFFLIRGGGGDREVSGAAGLALLSVLLIPAFHRGNTALRFRVGALLAAVGASMMPLAAGDPNIRNLQVPFIGASVLLAIGLRSWWTMLRDGRLWLRAAAVPLILGTAFIHFGMAPYRWLRRPAEYEASTVLKDKWMREMPLTDAEVPDQRAVFLTGNLGNNHGAYFFRVVEGLPMPKYWWLLSATRTEHIYSRPTSNRLELETVGRELQGWMRRPTFHVGERLGFPGLDVEILEVGNRGPTRVAFTFDRSLDDPSLIFIAGDAEKIKTIAPPAIGKSIRLPAPF
jgi:hypothetical protein